MAYVCGQPVELTEKPVQFTVAHMEDWEIVSEVPDYSMDGVTAEEEAAAAGQL